MSLANWAEPREGLSPSLPTFPVLALGTDQPPTSHVTVALGTFWVLGSWYKLHELGS